MPLVFCAAVVAHSAAMVSSMSDVVTAALDVTETVPSPLLFVFVNDQQRFLSAVSFDVSNERSTVPVYPPAGVTVMVDAADLP